MRGQDTYEKAIDDCSRTGDWGFREDFVREASRAISQAKSPRAAWQTLWRYHRLCRRPMERAMILRQGEMIHMWETASWAP